MGPVAACPVVRVLEVRHPGRLVERVERDVVAARGVPRVGIGVAPGVRGVPVVGLRRPVRTDQSLALGAPATRGPPRREPATRAPATRGPPRRGPATRGAATRAPPRRGPATRGPAAIVPRGRTLTAVRTPGRTGPVGSLPLAPPPGHGVMVRAGPRILGMGGRHGPQWSARVGAAWLVVERAPCATASIMVPTWTPRRVVGALGGEPMSSSRSSGSRRTGAPVAAPLRGRSLAGQWHPRQSFRRISPTSSLLRPALTGVISANA